MVRPLLTVALFLLVAAPTECFAQKRDVAKTASFSVVQVGTDLTVMDTSEVKEFKKGKEKEFQESMTAWQAAKKAAVKSKEKFTDPRPTKPKMKVHGKTFKSEESAKAYVADLEAKAAKRKKG